MRRRGEGAGRREGEMVDGEVSVERARLPMRVPVGGGDLAPEPEEGECSLLGIVSSGRVGVDFFVGEEGRSLVGVLRDRSEAEGSGASRRDSVADTAGDATENASSNRGLASA